MGEAKYCFLCFRGVDIESIEKVPDAVADNRILGKFKEM